MQNKNEHALSAFGANQDKEMVSDDRDSAPSSGKPSTSTLDRVLSELVTSSLEINPRVSVLGLHMTPEMAEALVKSAELQKQTAEITATEATKQAEINRMREISVAEEQTKQAVESTTQAIEETKRAEETTKQAEEDTKRTKEETKRKFGVYAIQFCGLVFTGVSLKYHVFNGGEGIAALLAIFGIKYAETIKDGVIDWRKAANTQSNG